MMLREEHPCRDDDHNDEEDTTREEDEEANSKRRIPSRLGSIALKLILLGLVLLVFEPSDEDDSVSASPITNNASTRVMFRQSRPWANTISMIAFYFAGSVIYSEVLMNRLLLAQSNNDNNSGSNNDLSVSIIIKHLPELLLVAVLGMALTFGKNGFGGDVAYFTFTCFTPWLVAANDVPGRDQERKTTSRRSSGQWIIVRLGLTLALLVVTHGALLFRDTETAVGFFQSPSFVNYCLSTTFVTCYFFRHAACPYLFGNNKNAAGVALLAQALVMVPPTAIIVFPSLIDTKDDDDDGSDHGAVFWACDYLIHTTICLGVVVLFCFCAKTFFVCGYSFSCNKTKKKETKATAKTTREQPQRQQKRTTATLLSSDDDDYILMVDNGSCTGKSNA